MAVSRDHYKLSSVDGLNTMSYTMRGVTQRSLYTRIFAKIDGPTQKSQLKFDYMKAKRLLQTRMKNKPKDSNEKKNLVPNDSHLWSKAGVLFC